MTIKEFTTAIRKNELGSRLTDRIFTFLEPDPSVFLFVNDFIYKMMEYPKSYQVFYELFKQYNLHYMDKKKTINYIKLLIAIIEFTSALYPEILDEDISTIKTTVSGTDYRSLIIKVGLSYMMEFTNEGKSGYLNIRYNVGGRTFGEGVYTSKFTLTMTSKDKEYVVGNSVDLSVTPLSYLDNIKLDNIPYKKAIEMATKNDIISSYIYNDEVFYTTNKFMVMDMHGAKELINGNSVDAIDTAKIIIKKREGIKND